jgi:hypothetical protein
MNLSLISGYLIFIIGGQSILIADFGFGSVAKPSNIFAMRP